MVVVRATVLSWNTELVAASGQLLLLLLSLLLSLLLVSLLVLLLVLHTQQVTQCLSSHRETVVNSHV